MTWFFFDFIILTLMMIFLAGFRHLIRQANERPKWLEILVFGVGPALHLTLTFVADSLERAPPSCCMPGPILCNGATYSRHVGEQFPDAAARLCPFF